MLICVVHILYICLLYLCYFPVQYLFLTLYQVICWMIWPIIPSIPSVSACLIFVVSAALGLADIDAWLSKSRCTKYCQQITKKNQSNTKKIQNISFSVERNLREATQATPKLNKSMFQDILIKINSKSDIST